MTSFVIDIFSDAICPWCYIGKRRLEKALKTLEEDHSLHERNVEIHWHPFELNPQMPSEGMDRKQYRSLKFGSWAKSLQLDGQVTEAAAGEGLEFHFDRMTRTPNTARAHRLVAFARQHGTENAVAEALFHTYFSEGRDVGDIAVVRDVAMSAGLDDLQAVAYIESYEGIEELKEAESQSRSLEIQGVPFFVLNGTRTISGAQPPDIIANAIREAVKEAMPAIEAAGEACSIEGGNC